MPDTTPEILGTTLEALGHDTSSALWGSELLLSQPGVIQEVHRRYWEAGSDLVESATYQLTPQNLQDHLSISPSQASNILQTGVNIVSDSTPAPSGPSRPGRGVVLSMGPFGSTLQPGQEYAGIYPAPFGPGGSSNCFLEDQTEQEEAAVEALAEHHLSKLLAIAADEQTWSKVEWIAFETIPVLHEARAIRRAMGRLEKKRRGGRKKFWIVAPFPDGLHPQILPSGKHAPLSLYLFTLLGLSQEDSVPDGVGVNCTNPSYLPTILGELTSLVTAYSTSVTKPWLVFYPDGGQVYDVVSRTWTVAPSSPANAQEWAERIGDLAIRYAHAHTEDQSETRIWRGIIVGGCCKSSFDEIKALRTVINRA
ncbi:hypothetical protein I350_03390 [Cryptococcus amylolentus CBS 6273]|nr:hypothetical protein I350_03390 [Cryptococcus amylolentus CBS 6273]